MLIELTVKLIRENLVTLNSWAIPAPTLSPPYKEPIAMRGVQGPDFKNTHLFYNFLKWPLFHFFSQAI